MIRVTKTFYKCVYSLVKGDWNRVLSLHYFDSENIAKCVHF